MGFASAPLGFASAPGVVGIDSLLVTGIAALKKHPSWRDAGGDPTTCCPLAVGSEFGWSRL
jgi:hypothetical protein